MRYVDSAPWDRRCAGHAKTHTYEGESMRSTISLVLTCGLAWTAPAFAEEGAAGFEYSPVARLVQGGQFRAEVWRRDVATDSSEIAWSDSELSPTAAKAIGEACAAPRTPRIEKNASTLR